jgi:xanthine dehydrogenase accessory factor
MNWLKELAKLEEQGRPCVMVLVTGCSGSTPASSGARMLVTAEGRVAGTIGGGSVEQSAIARALELLGKGGLHSSRETLSSHGQCCGGMVELLFECFFDGPRLFLFGGGHVGSELIKLFEGTRFSVILIDPRKDWPQPGCLPAGVQRVLSGELDYLEQITVSQRDYLMAMTPSHETDYQLMKNSLAMPFAWHGVIGSRSKALQFRRRLKEDGLADELVSRMHCPVGERDVGSSPREVALAIAHELLLQDAHQQRGATA